MWTAPVNASIGAVANPVLVIAKELPRVSNSGLSSSLQILCGLRNISPQETAVISGGAGSDLIKENEHWLRDLTSP